MFKQKDLTKKFVLINKDFENTEESNIEGIITQMLEERRDITTDEFAMTILVPENDRQLLLDELAFLEKMTSKDYDETEVKAFCDMMLTLNIDIIEV